MEAKILTLPSVNWPAFAHLTKKYLGETPTRKMDQQKIPCDNLTTYNMCLNMLQQNKSLALIPITVMLYDRIQNIHRLTKYMESIEFEDRGIEEQFCVATGNLSDWKTNIINCCPMLLANALYLEFYNNGVGFVFDDYKRVVHEEKKSFKLVYKG